MANKIKDFNILVSEIRNMTVDEQHKEIHRLSKQLFIFRMQKNTDQAPKSHWSQLVRHSIARIKTVLREQDKK